jgi:hypothetical protein
MFKFFAGTFAIAGLIAAAGPIIIHLLNRRRFRVVEWAAMDFLRQAMQRSRRAVQLRDLLVLVLRCLAVVIFGVALARPFLSGVSSATMLIGIGTVLAIVGAVGTAASGILTSQRKVRGLSFGVCALCGGLGAIGLFSMLRDANDQSLGVLTSRQPIHAVLLIDNSMSMGYESLEGTLLDRARTKAAEFIDALPSGSHINVLPLCGSDEADTTSAYRNKSDARAALDRIQVVDRIGRANFAIDQAVAACRQVPELPSKRVVLISDQQANLWAGGANSSQFAALPDFQIMRIAPEEIENVWVSDFELQDGVADTETPAVFLATIQHAGSHPLTNVQIQLSIDGSEIASRLVDLEPGQARQIEFRQRLDSVTDTGALGSGISQATFVRATVTASVEGGVGDRLLRDNSRSIIVPVVGGLPVVFVDQYGETENQDRGEVGETYRLRRLLAPQTSTDEELNRQLVRIRHLTIDRLTEEVLSDARLVVIAGVESPGESVPLLRQYVEQGGSLIIAAGADFDASEWAAEAWLEGAGILPAQLTTEPVGQLPEVAVGLLEPFYLDFRSLQHDFFLIEGETQDSLADLYRVPLFFKAVAVETDQLMSDALVAAVADRITKTREHLSVSDSSREKWEQLDRQGNLSDEQVSERAFDEARRREVQPRWLSWSDTDELSRLDELSPVELAERSRPRILARYTLDERPFLIERRIGAGRSFFLSSGLFSSWNTLTSTNAILMFDRMLRQLLEDTLPRRNYETGDVVTLPARRSDQLRWELIQPDGSRDAVSVEALSAERYGLRIHRAVNNGHYEVVATSTSADADVTADQAVEGATLLAFNCPAEESQLDTLDALAFEERAGTEGYRWLEADETISVEGARLRGRDLWKWLIGAVLIFLLIEMLILAWPNRRAEIVPQNA